jgi:serine/threonine-protein kinase
LLREEVRMARQVSHPNVCRVWDLGETEGLHFVAMEYVDGEDLASLVRRIGRLPEDRGVQVAREICAGLAAIHDQGVLHRDLKPANVMLDGRGRVRIADFGLATLAGSVLGADTRSGTPAYMAPEQIEGREVTARSDIYALGLVLYEVFTGRHAFPSGGDVSRRTAQSQPSTPSSHVPSLDPVLERAILRCVEPDPASRPSSAQAVAHALPGGDPLAAAVSAGETPSPEMVAAAGGVGGLSPATIVGCLALLAAGIAGVLAMSERVGLPFGPDDKPHAALRDRAVEFLRTLELPAGGSVLDGFSRERGDSLASSSSPVASVFYFYRRSPGAIPLVEDERIAMGGSAFALPSLEVPGETAVRLDLDGRLREFRLVPPARDTLATEGPDWTPYFAAAGLAGAERTTETPRTVPPVPADAQAAWTIAGPEASRRIEGASYRGRVTHFSVGAAYAPPRLTPGDLTRSTITAFVTIVLFVLAAYFARRNLTRGRADTRGAFRLSLVLGVLSVLGWGLFSQPYAGLPGSATVTMAGTTLFWASFLGLAYLALEPIVRRKHPEWLTAWTRLLEGRWLDPLVGRHVLVGLIGGVALVLVSELRLILERATPQGDFQAAAIGGWIALGVVLRGLASGALVSLVLALMLVLFQMLTRRNAWGWVLWIPFTFFTMEADVPPALLWVVGLQVVIMAVVMGRFGLLAMATALSVFSMTNAEILTTRLDAWYAGVTVAVLFTLALLAAWGTAAALRTPRGLRSGVSQG